MRKLIKRDKQGNWSVVGLPWEEISEGNVLSHQAREVLYSCLCKLKDYEKSELEPEQFFELHDLLETCQEIADLKRKAITPEKEVYDVNKVLNTLKKYKLQQSENEMLSEHGKWIVQRVLRECEKIVKAGLTFEEMS